MALGEVYSEQQLAFFKKNASTVFLDDLEDYTSTAKLLLQQETILDVPEEASQIVYRTPKHPLNGAYAYIAAIIEVGIDASFVSADPTYGSTTNPNTLCVYAQEENIDAFHILTGSEARTYSTYAEILNSVYGGGHTVFRNKPLPKRIFPSLPAQAHMSALLLTAPKLGVTDSPTRMQEDLRVIEDYRVLGNAGVRPLNPEQIHGLAWRVLEGMLDLYPNIREQVN